MASLKRQIEDIKNLMKKGEYKKAEIWIDKLLVFIPDSRLLNKYKADILRSKGSFIESLNIYNKLLDNEFEIDTILKNIIYVYFDMGEYEKTLEYIEKYEANSHNEYDSYLSDNIKACCEFYLGRELTVERKKCYFIRQMLNYSDYVALSYIKEHCKEDSADDYFIFSDGVDINDLFYKVKDNITNFKRIYGLSAMATYIIKVENVGIYRGIYTNYLTVIAFPQSNQIITMYPSDSSKCFDESYINHFDSYEKRENINYSSRYKVKRLSQIEKFNNKYKNYKHQ